MIQKSPLAGMAICLFVIALSFWNFSISTNSDTVSNIQMLTLLIAGAAIGVFITLFVALIKKRSTKTM